MVPKPNGDIRLCVDYRKLNRVMVIDKYPLPRIDEIKNGIKGKNFTTLDLKDEFNQIPIEEGTL